MTVIFAFKLNATVTALLIPRCSASILLPIYYLLLLSTRLFCKHQKHEVQNPSIKIHRRKKQLSITHLHQIPTFRFKRNDMFRQQLVHLEHIGTVSLKHQAQLIIANDFPFVTWILEIIFSYVSPRLLHNLNPNDKDF